MAYAQLRRARQQVGAFEPGRVAAVEREMCGHQFVRAYFDCGLVIDIERRIARLARPEEQGDVIAPGHKRTVEEAQCLAPALHEMGELLGLLRAERDPALHVDAAEQPGRIHAVMDVLRLDVGFECGPGAREQVAVTGGVDHDPCTYGPAPLLALEDCAAHRTRLENRRRGPGVQHEAHAALEHEPLRSQS